MICYHDKHLVTPPMLNESLYTLSATHDGYYISSILLQEVFTWGSASFIGRSGENRLPVQLSVFPPGDTIIKVSDHQRVSNGANQTELAHMWGLCCQKQVSQAGISNYIPQFTVGCNYLSLLGRHIFMMLNGHASLSNILYLFFCDHTERNQI